jgi:hypothetical protein
MNKNIMNKGECCTTLYKQFLRFIKDICDIFPDEGTFFAIKFYLENAVNAKTVMKNYINFVYTWEKEISERNEKFFMENENIFGDVPSHIKRNKDYIKDLWRSPKLLAADRILLWEYFDTFNSLARQYLRQISKPCNECKNLFDTKFVYCPLCGNKFAKFVIDEKMMENNICTTKLNKCKKCNIECCIKYCGMCGDNLKKD